VEAKKKYWVVSTQIWVQTTQHCLECNKGLKLTEKTTNLCLIQVFLLHFLIFPLFFSALQRTKFDGFFLKLAQCQTKAISPTLHPS